MNEPFWLWSMSPWDYATIKAFLAEQNPENERLTTKSLRHSRADGGCLRTSSKV